MPAANCYECAHRGNVPGSAHSSCDVLRARTGKSGGEMLAAMVMMTSGVVDVAGVRVSGNHHGIRSGWFSWPVDYDPAWLTECTGFEETVKAP